MADQNHHGSQKRGSGRNQYARRRKILDFLDRRMMGLCNKVTEKFDGGIQKLGRDDKADTDNDGDDEADEMLPEAIRIVVEMQQASTTMLQKKLKLGYARASRLIMTLRREES